MLRNAARLELIDFDGDMEDSVLDAHTQGIVSALVEQGAYFLDAVGVWLQFQGDEVAFLVVLDTVLVPVRIELELGGIFVAFFAVGIIDGHSILLAFEALVGHVIVPGDVFFVRKFAHFAHCPDGTLCLVYADDVDGIGEL